MVVNLSLRPEQIKRMLAREITFAGRARDDFLISKGVTALKASKNL